MAIFSKLAKDASAVVKNNAALGVLGAGVFAGVGGGLIFAGYKFKHEYGIRNKNLSRPFAGSNELDSDKASEDFTGFVTEFPPSDPQMKRASLPRSSEEHVEIHIF